MGSSIEKTELSHIAPDYEYVKLTRDQIFEKTESLQNLYEKYFPQTEDKKKSRVLFAGGYFFMPPFNNRVIKIDGEDKDFNDEYYRLENEIVDSIYPQHNSPETMKAKNIMATEYKIHLMPKPEFTLSVIEKLLAAIKDDAELRQCVSGFKVINDEEKQRDEVMPTIVLYAQLGKENAQKALNKIYGLFHQYAHIGKDETPRYNKKIDELIYYANGGGDLKKRYSTGLKRLKKDIESQDIFDSDFVHFKGDYKLEVPTQ